VLSRHGHADAQSRPDRLLPPAAESSQLSRTPVARAVTGVSRNLCRGGRTHHLGRRPPKAPRACGSARGSSFSIHRVVVGVRGMDVPSLRCRSPAVGEGRLRRPGVSLARTVERSDRPGRGRLAVPRGPPARRPAARPVISVLGILRPDPLHVAHELPRQLQGSRSAGSAIEGRWKPQPRRVVAGGAGLRRRVAQRASPTPAERETGLSLVPRGSRVDHHQDTRAARRRQGGEAPADDGGAGHSERRVP
jgi:hypothetical protein